jgi:hypothetical protein
MKKLYFLALLMIVLLAGQNSSSSLALSVKAQPAVCKVHGDVLKPEKVRIEYGLFNFNQDWLLGTEREKLFPNANQFITEACKTEKDIRDDGSCARRAGPKYQQVLYCQKCRDAEKEWLKARGMKKPYYRTGIPF